MFLIRPRIHNMNVSIRRLVVVRMIGSLMMMVTSQSPSNGGWTGCVNRDLSKNQNLVRIQQPTRVCLSIANHTDWNSGTTSYVRASFEPQGDVYSRFHIPNCTLLLLWLLWYSIFIFG
jgi:hypothetical protein